MPSEKIEFAKVFQQKLIEVKQLPLIAGHTTVIRTTKHSGGVSLTLECLIAAVKVASEKNFLYVNAVEQVINARVFLAKFGGGIDVYNTPEPQWDANITSFIIDNNLYLPASTSCIPLVKFIGVAEKDTDPLVVDYYFLNNVPEDEIQKLQKANPNAVFVVNELIPEGKELIEFSSYCHKSD